MATWVHSCSHWVDFFVKNGLKDEMQEPLTQEMVEEAISYLRKYNSFPGKDSAPSEEQDDFYTRFVY